MAKQQYQQGLLNQVMTNPASIGTELGQLFDPRFMSQVKPMSQDQAIDLALDAPMMAGTIKNVAKTAFETAQEVAQRNATLPASKGGLGLPVSNTAMDRAKAMGYNMPTYHGTNADIKAFDPSLSSDTVSYMKGTFTADNPKMTENYGDIIYPLLQRQGITIRDKANARRSGLEVPKVDTIYDKEKGILVTNKAENLRSRFAAFDPFRRNEADILAGVGAVPLGLLNIDEKKKRANEKPKKK